MSLSIALHLLFENRSFVDLLRLTSGISGVSFLPSSLCCWLELTRVTGGRPWQVVVRDRWSSVTGGRLWQVVVRVGCSAGRKLTIFSSRNECKTSKYIRDRIKYCVGSMLGSYLNFGNDSVVDHFAFLGHGSKHEQNPSLSKSWKISVWLS